MPQVVDSQNLVQLVTTGSVPEFKAPEAPKPDAKPSESPDAKPEAKPEGDAKPEGGEAKSDAGKSEPARDDKGKFVKADDAGKDKPAGDADKKSDDDEDAELPERVRKQIGKKHRRMMEAEEFARERDQAAERERIRADAAERELQRLRGGKSEGPKPGASESVDPDEPKPGDFKTVGEYTRALVKYEAKKAGEAGRAKAAEQRQQERADTQIAAFVQRQDEFRVANPDYDDIVGAADIEAPPAVMQYLIESDVGPALTLHLAKNPDEVSRLRKLTPSRQVAELGKLEIKFEKKPDPPANGNGSAATREISKAPAPIAPLEAKTTPIQKDPSQMSVSELREFRRQEALAKQR